MLILTRKQGESFIIGDNIEISISEINGDRVRIAIEAPKEVKILRKELKEASELNKEAVSAAIKPDTQAFANILKNVTKNS